MSEANDRFSTSGAGKGLPSKTRSGRAQDRDRIVGSALHPEIQTSFITLPSFLSVVETRTIIEGRKDEDAVVIRRVLNDTPRYYLVSCYELRHILRDQNPENAIDVALNLHERDHAEAVPRILAEKRLRERSTFNRPTVVTEDDRVVGYLGFKVYLAEPPKMERRLDRGKERSHEYGIAVPDSVRTARRGMAAEEIDAAKGTATAEPSPAMRSVVQPDAPSLCYFAAEVPEGAVVGVTQQVQTTISREELAAAIGPSSQKDSAPLAASPDRKITVRLIPKRNFEVVGDSRIDIKAPDPGDPPVVLFFDVKPTSAGEGEIWIAFCQGPLALVTLKLKPEILTAQAAGTAVPIKAEAAVEPNVTEPMSMNVMNVYRADNGGKIRYKYDLYLDSAGIDDDYESPEFGDDIVTILKPYMNLFDAVETTTDTDFEQLQIQLRSIGARLFQKLFPTELQRVFWEHRDQITHLKFYCEEPYIPWELLHVCEPGEPPTAETKCLGQMGLVRWLHGHKAPRNLRIRPGRARYVTPSYPGKELKSAQHEGDLLKELFDATPITPATRPEITKLLSQKGPFDLFHFAGHGEASETQITDARIELEPAGSDANKRLRDLTPDIISGLCHLKAEDGTQPIVVLNSCRAGKVGQYVTGLGGFAPAFLEREAGIFVGALWMIGDKPALTFVKAFYKALRDGKCVAEAVVTGRETARKEGDATYLAYVVYGDPFARMAQ